jgi:hypothetical protein
VVLLELMKPPVSEKRAAANRANAARSTGPRTPEGKARSSQNGRKFTFNPGNYAMVRVEKPEDIANLRADAIAYYRPVNSQEMLAVERIALAQHEMLRVAALGSGLHTNCLDDALDCQGKPRILHQPDLTDGIKVTPGQNHNYWLAFGFRRIIQVHPQVFPYFFRYQAQAERLYRRAVDDFERLEKRREKWETEPMIDPQAEQLKPLIAPEPNPPESPVDPPAAAPAESPLPVTPSPAPAAPYCPVSSPELPPQPGGNIPNSPLDQ